MKLTLLFILTVFSLSAFAAWNEVECTGRIDGKTFNMDVEQSFPNGSYFKRAQLTVTDNGAVETFDYTVTARGTGFNRVQYSAPGVTLEVDFWPDQRPAWGRNYRGTLRSSDLDNQYIQGLNCRFPNAF